MLLSMIPFPKVHSHFTLTSLSLHSHFTLTSLSLLSRFFLASSFFTLLCCPVALLLTGEWLTYQQPRPPQRRVRVCPKQFYGLSEHNADISCVLSSRLQQHCSPQPGPPLPSWPPVSPLPPLPPGLSRSSYLPPRASPPSNEAQASGVVGKLILIQTVEVNVVLVGSGSNEC